MFTAFFLLASAMAYLSSDLYRSASDYLATVFLNVPCSSMFWNDDVIFSTR